MAPLLKLSLSFTLCREKQPPPRLTLRDLQNKSTSSPSLSTNSTSSVFPNLSSNPAATLPLEKTAPVLAPQGSSTLSGSANLPAGLPASTHPLEFSLTNVTVPLESIKPSEFEQSFGERSYPKASGLAHLLWWNLQLGGWGGEKWKNW